MAMVITMLCSTNLAPTDSFLPEMIRDTFAAYLSSVDRYLCKSNNFTINRKFNDPNVRVLLSASKELTVNVRIK